MSVLVYNHRPLSARPLGRWLGEAGELVMVTTRAAVAASPPGERALFAAIMPVADYASGEVQRAARRLARAWEPDHVASSSEYDLIRAAVLRERCGLAGQGVASALAYRDKFRMRAAALAGGMRVPAFAGVRTHAEVLGFAERAGFPVVLKPRLGTGTAGITVVRSGRDLAGLAGQAWRRRPGPGRLVVEEYVDAPMYHVDGMCLAGKVVHCWPSRYSAGALDDVAGGRPRTSIMLAAEDPLRRRLQAWAAQLVGVFPHAGAGFGFHVELWVPNDGVPVLCEVAARAATEMIVGTYERAFGVNLYRESFRVQAGLPPHLASQPASPGCYTGWVCFLAAGGTFWPPATAGMPSAVFFEVLMQPGQRYERASAVTNVAARAVVQGATAEEAAGQLAELTRWWAVSRPWQ
jgi:biotin carboxylase